MSVLIDALQPQLARGLLVLRGDQPTTLDDLLGEKGAFYPSFEASSGVWEFDFQTEGKVSGFLAHECGRFGTASFQSYSDVPSALLNQNLIPWALVRAYYAAFYAGHALLRAFGCSCTYIDGPRTTILKKILSLYSIGASFSAGLYSTEMTSSGTAMRLRNLGQGHGGTHEAFWKMFAARIHALERGILSGPLPRPDAQQAYLALGRLRTVLTKAGADGSWLSSVRNAVQYRHAMDVWFPRCRVASGERALLSRIATTWLQDPLLVEIPTGEVGPLPAFIFACALMVSCCRALLVRLGEKGRMGREQSFAYYGPLRYLRTHHLMT